MKVTALELGVILNGGRRTALLPATTDPPQGRTSLHRRKGQPVAHVLIAEAELVGPLDELVDDLYARQAGHPDADAYRDEWCRTHRAAWTGMSAWLVTFTILPHREQVRPFGGGVRDPGNPADGVGAARKGAPEPDVLDTDRLSRVWKEGALRRHAEAKGRTTAPGNRKAA